MFDSLDLETFGEALHRVNKRARQHAADSQDAYQSGWKRQAKVESVRKNALYRYKTYVLKLLYGHGDATLDGLHEINGDDFLSFTVNGWEFHTPTDQWESVTVETELPAGDTDVDSLATGAVEHEELDEFDPDLEPADDTMDTQEALELLADKTPKSPNDFLPPFLDSRPIGWSFLPGYITEGDTVSEDTFRAESHREFELAIGGRFTTIEHGPVEITDRYGAYLSPRLYREPISLRPVYDIHIKGDDTTQTSIRQDTVINDWRIEITDLDDPAPDLNGPLAEYIEPPDPPFEIGDELTVESPHDDEESFHYRVDAAEASVGQAFFHLSSLDADSYDEVFALDEFEDYISHISN